MDEHLSGDYPEDLPFGEFSDLPSNGGGGIVISCRIRIVRNLAEFPFVGVCSDDQQTQIRTTILGELQNHSELADIPVVDSEQLLELERQFLLELYSVTKSPDLADCQLSGEFEAFAVDDADVGTADSAPDELDDEPELDGDALAVEFQHQLTEAIDSLDDCPPLTPDSSDGRECVEDAFLTVNDEDHVSVQVVGAGFDLTGCWRRADRVDDAFEQAFNYAFSPRWGYLTASPGNVGTGMRASALLHLPALAALGRLDKVFRLLIRNGVSGRAAFGENAWGDFYRIANQSTLGQTEAELVMLVQCIVPVLVEYEQKARQLLLRQSADAISEQSDRACRALVLPVRRSEEELLSLVSAVRLGIAVGTVDDQRIEQVRETLELTRLKKQLAVAVMMENYDSATKYRDRIRQLEERRYGH